MHTSAVSTKHEICDVLNVQQADSEVKAEDVMRVVLAEQAVECGSPLNPSTTMMSATSSLLNVLLPLLCPCRLKNTCQLV